MFKGSSVNVDLSSSVHIREKTTSVIFKYCIISCTHYYKATLQVAIVLYFSIEGTLGNIQFLPGFTWESCRVCYTL